MKNLKDLKEDILNNNLKNFYIFWGEDYGLRHHYCEEITKRFGAKRLTLLDEVNQLRDVKSSGGLFVTKKVFIIYNDVDFAKMKVKEIHKLINNLKHEILICCYSDNLNNSNLFKEYDDNITYFPCVQSKIALQFVDSEIKLDMTSKEQLARDCDNNYSSILLECDKIRSYANEKNVSEQEAYDTLYNNNQLMFKPIKFNYAYMMDDVLKGNFKGLSFWYQLIKLTCNEDFWIYVENIVQDLCIAYLIKKHGRKNGSELCWNYKFNWGRTVAIRDYIIPYSDEQILDMMYLTSNMDSLIKNGSLDKEKAIDYFLCLVI